MKTPRYYALSAYLRQRFGQRVQKIPLDAGFTCPNRDGHLSSKGCIFCNERGSGSGLHQSSTIAEQWELWREKLKKKYKAKLFMAYFQSFSNTYGPLEKLQNTLDSLNQLPKNSGLVGVSLGTRPDCLDKEKLQLLTDQPFDEVWLELGLQSSNNKTLARINRGHTAEQFAEAVHMAADLGLRICAHVIHGLPGESSTDFLETTRFATALPIHGIKFHNLYVCSGSTLATQWKNSLYTPPSRQDYTTALVTAIAAMRQDVIIHRLTGDPAPGEHLAPDWACRKNELLTAISEQLEDNDIWQGKALGEEVPSWFEASGGLPDSLK